MVPLGKSGLTKIGALEVQVKGVTTRPPPAHYGLPPVCGRDHTATACSLRPAACLWT